MTVLMSDLRSSTPMSERLDPEQVVDILNRSLAEGGRARGPSAAGAATAGAA